MFTLPIDSKVVI